MSKKIKVLDDYSKWWLREDIEWSNIGADVVKRPTEITAFRNLSIESNYIRNLDKWELKLTQDELYIQHLDYLVNDKNFNYKQYKKLYRKDSVVTKISKLSGYSEKHVNRILKNITRKTYLKYILGINKVSTNSTNYNKRKQYFKDKLSKYKRVY